MTHPTSKVIFWNIWAHRHPDGLHQFLAQHMPEADIIGLTEVTDIPGGYVGIPYCHTGLTKGEPPSQLNGMTQLDQLIDDYGGHYCSSYTTPLIESRKCKVTGTPFSDIGFGSALLYRHDLRLVAQGNVPICSGMDDVYERVLQWIIYLKGSEVVFYGHWHGVWLEHNTKGDDPIRIQQSLQVLAVVGQLRAKYKVDKIIFGGDLNLDIKTDAVAMLKDNCRKYGGPYRNMIEESGVKDTRTSAYRKYHLPEESKFADYVFVDPSVDVQDFAVHNNILASDHAPLVLTFK